MICDLGCTSDSEGQVIKKDIHRHWMFLSVFRVELKLQIQLFPKHIAAICSYYQIYIKKQTMTTTAKQYSPILNTLTLGILT